MLEKRERSAVKTPVSDQNKRSFAQGGVLRFDKQLWWLPGRNLCCGDQITQRAKAALERKSSFLDSLCIEPNSAELDKISSIRAREVNKTYVSGLNNLPAKLKIVRRQAELHGEDVHGAHRQNA